MARRLDFELTPVQLFKRMSGWKDSTLINRLKQNGFTAYSPNYTKRIKKGSYIIPPNRRTQLQKQYAKLLKNVAVPSGWLTLNQWLKRKQLEYPALNIPFSQGRMSKYFKYVYTSILSRTAFSNKKRVGAPEQKIPTQQHVVYFISVEYPTEVDTWVQSSPRLYYGSNPVGDDETKLAEEQVIAMQTTNDNIGDRSKFRYTFNKTSKDSTYTFIGIGVIL